MNEDVGLEQGRMAVKETQDSSIHEALIEELSTLREAMLDRQAHSDLWMRDVAAKHRGSAINLAHYLAMRHVDLRPLQARLSELGLSSLGHAETHVMDNVDKVLRVLRIMSGQAAVRVSTDVEMDAPDGARQLGHNAETLFGPSPAARGVRVMVTLPSEAADDDGLVASLVAGGMDVARINCAHDDAVAWTRMADRVRAAARAAGREVKVLMDLAGPKLRTGPIESGMPVVKVKPKRNDYGQTEAPALVGLRAFDSHHAVAGVKTWIGVDPAWLRQIEPGDVIEVDDASFSRRKFAVKERAAPYVIMSCKRTVYLTPDTSLRLRRGRDVSIESGILQVPTSSSHIELHRGDILTLTSSGLGHGAILPSKGKPGRPARIACTWPEALAQARLGDHVWFDDGRIGSRVTRVGEGEIDLEITDARDDGQKLAADKSIHFPDTALKLKALTAKDKDDLVAAARVADIVGLSFAQSSDDVRSLLRRLNELGAGHVGLLMKIETRLGFEQLPEMLFAAMAAPAAGVVIARGSLAIECGYERMAEVQEEIMWACEAAHMPVVWATQVLETLAKTGLPSRAEVTDAALGGRAECVMLNKGPHILEAMRSLGDILQRVQGHQCRKRSLLRALESWGQP